MEPEKRNMIVNEIDQWRKSKLLPEQYCDFLLNLYLEDPSDRPKKLLGISTASIMNSGWKSWLLVISSIALIFLFILNFTSFTLPLQIALEALFLVILYSSGTRLKATRPLLSLMLCGIAFVFLLFTGIYLMDLYGVGETGYYQIFLAICSILWIATGFTARQFAFHLCGWIGLLLIYVWVLHDQPGMNPLMIQAALSPLSLLLGWLGWLIQRKNKAAGGALFASGCLAWFMPEIYGMLYAAEMTKPYLQSMWLGKIVTAGLVLFFLRKKWIEWVA